jgi:hypothetical protein
MAMWGMESRYYSFDRGGYHFVVMDRNFLRNADGVLVDYHSSNWGPVAAPGRSFSDAVQLAWLEKDLAVAVHPVIVFMHQPVFLSDFFQEIGNADEILRLFDQANLKAERDHKHNRVAVVFMGHDHDDRYGERNGVHYFILNSRGEVSDEDQRSCAAAMISRCRRRVLGGIFLKPVLAAGFLCLALIGNQHYIEIKSFNTAR